MSNVITNLQPTIDYAVAAYAGKNASPLVKSRARLLAAQAVKSYNPKAGTKLKTFVQQHLQAIQRLAPHINDPLSPSDRFRRDQQQITQGTNQLYENLGREPSDDELSDHTGLSIKRLRKVRSRMRGRLPFTVYEDQGEEDDSNDVVGSTRLPYDDWQDAVYHDLPEQDKIIFVHRTGYGGADVLSNQEIAAKLNISPAAVSQKAAKLQAKLDQFHG